MSSSGSYGRSRIRNTSRARKSSRRTLRTASNESGLGCAREKGWQHGFATSLYVFYADAFCLLVAEAV